MGRLVLPEFTVLRDSREKENFGWQFKPSKPERRPPRCAGTVVGTLKTGDYSIAGEMGESLVCVERKADFSELWVNYNNKQLFEEECERMRSYRYKYVLIESQLTSDILSLSPPQISKVPGHVLISWLISLANEYGINIMCVGNCGRHFAQLIFEDVIRREKSLWVSL
jgi:ERCC4-type nuclease